MRTERVSFTGAHGHELAGRLDLPEADELAESGGRPFAYALFAHCFTCSKDLRIVREVGQRLTAAGMGLLRFDFTGLGHSDGDFAETTFSGNLGDLRAAAEWLRDHHGPVGLLIGHSLGGAAVLQLAGELADCRAVATIGAPHDPAHVRHLLRGAEFGEGGRAEVSIGGRPFEIGREFVEDLERHEPDGRIAQLGRPLLIFHSPVDRVVGIDNAERIYRAARHPKSFVSLGDADHLVSEAGDARFVGDVLAAWARHQLG